MSSFDKSMPIVNPRRYLKMVDNMASVLTDAEVKGMVNDKVPVTDEKYNDPRRLTPIQNWSDSNIGTSDLVFHNNAEIAIFLCRFFTEIRNVGKDQLVQLMDDGVHSTYGIFIQTRKARSLTEYQELSESDKEIADRIIEIWKEIEDEIRSWCIKDLDSSKSIVSLGRLRIARNELASSIQHAEKVVDSYNYTFTSESKLSEIKESFANISKAYVKVLDCTDVLETAIVIFAVNVQSFLYKLGINISVPAVTGFVVPIDSVIKYEDAGEYAKKAEEINSKVKSLIHANQRVIRRWFTKLGLTLYDLR